jgi:polar amino acid transport system substrate-binding protein
MKIFFIILFCSLSLFPSESIKVGITSSEPFVMYNENSQKYEGFSIDLWNYISRELNINTEYIYIDKFPSLIDSVAKNNIDLAISGITITYDREKYLDFSHPMFSTGLGVMTLSGHSDVSLMDTLWKDVIMSFSIDLFKYFFIYIFIIMNIRWIVNITSKNEETIFSKNYFIGMYESFWWTMTMLVTWEAPKSHGFMRGVDLSIYIVGIVGLSMFTAVVTSSLSTQKISSIIKDENDLKTKTVVTVKNVAPARYLKKIGVNTIEVDSIYDGMKLLKNKKVKYLVYDKPRLQYLAKKFNKDLQSNIFQVDNILFNHQDYGIALSQKFKYKEEVNQLLLKIKESDGYNPSYFNTLKLKWGLQ